MDSESLQKIRELKNRVAGKRTGGFDRDSILYRYLDINDFNVDKAEKQFLTNMEWREKNVESWIANFKNETLEKICKIEFIGITKNGEPVVFYPIGTLDFKKIIQLNLKEDFTRLNIWLLEKMQKMCLENEKPGEEFKRPIIIADYYGHSLKQIASFGILDMVKDLCILYDSRYPLIMQKAFAIRAPKIFSIMFNVIKKVLSAKALKPLVIYKENDTKMTSDLIKTLGADLVPIDLGGNYKLKYSKTEAEIDEDEMDDFVPLEIDAGQTLNVEFEVFEPQTVLNWSFKTEGYDIGFGLLLNGKKEVIPKQRVNSHEEIVVGSFTCEKVGKYALIFDNGYSQMRSKTVNYIVTMTEPDEDEEDDE